MMSDARLVGEIELLPILPLRNSVVFPASMVPINVGRLRSVRLVEDLVGQERAVVGIDLSPHMATLAKGRLDGALVADMRSLPLATESVGGIVAFYSVIHLRRTQVGSTFGEFHRVLRGGGRILLSAHEGDGEVELDEFIGERVPFAATLFQLDELVRACEEAGLDVTLAERRPPHANEGKTIRLFVEAEKPRRVQG